MGNTRGKVKQKAIISVKKKSSNYTKMEGDGMKKVEKSKKRKAPSAMDTSESGATTAAFVPEKKSKTASSTDTRKITVPQNRVRPLKTNWKKIFDPIVEMLGLQIRYNIKTRQVEIR